MNAQWSLFSSKSQTFWLGQVNFGTIWWDNFRYNLGKILKNTYTNSPLLWFMEQSLQFDTHGAVGNITSRKLCWTISRENLGDNLGNNLKNTYTNSPLLWFMGPSGHLDTQWVASLPENLAVSRKINSGRAIIMATIHIRTATKIVIGRPIRGFRGLIIALYLIKTM